MLSQSCSPLLERLDACHILNWTHLTASLRPSNASSFRPFQQLRTQLGVNPIQERVNTGLQWKSSHRFETLSAFKEDEYVANAESYMENDWEVDIVNEIDPLAFQSPRRQRKRGEASSPSVLDDENKLADWTARARERALLLLQSRDPNIRAESVFSKKKSKKGTRKERPLAITEKNIVGKATVQLSGQVKSLMRQDDVERKNVDVAASQVDKDLGRKEWDFNKRLLESKDAQEVLNLVRSATEGTQLRGLPSVLSPLNVATVLHRIARHMESSSMPKSSRLAFARQRQMAELVSEAIEVLPDCSAQGLANIAWALGKVGGSSLYSSEMDRIAGIAMPWIIEFNAQNIANMAGAYASMQHSVPSLFTEFASHAAHIAESFRSQELAQVLWAFASLCQPATLLLDALDRICLGFAQKKEKNSSVKVRTPVWPSRLENPANDIGNPVRGTLKQTDYWHAEAEGRARLILSGEKKINGELRTSKDEKNAMQDVLLKASCAESFTAQGKTTANPFMNATRGQLANMAWSYAVLDQLSRPSFAHIWQTLVSIGSTVDEWMVGDSSIVQHMSQIHQTNLSLQLEYPHLGFTLGGLFRDVVTQTWDKQKSCTLSRSVHQKEVERLLVSTGYKWVAEYTGADYSLDIALVERKIGIEIDGPTHFTRNTGEALGHTVLKRRLMAKAGWTVLSISYQEWEELDGEAEHMLFLRNMLRDYL